VCAKKGLERIFAASFALAGLLTGWSAAADSISYSQPFTYMLSVSGQTYAAGTTEPSAQFTSTSALPSVTFPLFDLSLGELTGIFLRLDGTFEWQTAFHGMNTNPGESVGVDFVSSLLLGPQLSAFDYSKQYSCPAQGADDSCQQSHTVGPEPPVSDSWRTPGPPEYTGGGFDPTLTLTEFLQCGGRGCEVDGSVTASIAGTWTETYEYMPVPEPSTAIPCAMGLVALGAKRRPL